MTQAKYLALDLGATKFASMQSTDGTPGPVRTMTIPTLNDASKEFSRICHFLAEDMAAIKGQPVLCAAPSLDDDGVVVSWPNRPYWSGFPLLKQFERCLGTPVACLGDGEAAALADAGTSDGVVYISLYFGTGIAGGIVANGKVLRFGGVNSELGHIVVDPNGPICVCGKAGCAQAVWRSFVEGNTPHGQLIENLARLSVTLSQIFPACVITLGGRLLDSSEEVSAEIAAAVAKMAPPTAWSPRVRKSTFGSRAPLVGSLNEAARRERSQEG